jgi:DNA-binding transcriptional LysR family regulator
MDKRADVAIRVGPMRASQLMARRLGQSRMVVVAAPAYLTRRGVPQTPHDLDAHNCIAFNFARHCDEWPFVIDGAYLSLPIRGDVVVSDGEISRRLALAGQGSASRPLPVMGHSKGRREWRVPCRPRLREEAARGGRALGRARPSARRADAAPSRPPAGMR